MPFLLPIFIIALLVSAGLAEARTRTITIDNQCKGTIWPAFAGPPATKTSGGQQPYGWAQPPGTTTITVPDPWVSTRVWARTGCNTDGSGCKIGFCKDNKMECDGKDYGGQGATLAEFTIDGSSQYGDFYDVSAVDGYNLPMVIEPIGGKGGGCETASCGAETDLLAHCDPRLIFPPGSANIWSCGTPCLVGYELSSTFDPMNSEWCCQKGGVAMPQDTCTSSMIPFYGVYKDMCKSAYVFAQDDRNTAVFACQGPDYKVTFCPGGRGAGVNPPLANAAVSQKPGNSAGIDGGSDNYIHVQAPITETWTGTGGPVPATPTASSGASQPTGQSKSATTSHVTTRSDSAQKPFTTPHASSSSISGGSGAASSSSSRGSHPTASPTGGHECKRKRKRRYE